MHTETERCHGEHCDHAKGKRQAHIGNAQHAITKRVDDVDQGIEFGNIDPELGQQIHGVKYATQVNQWREHKGGDNGNIIEAVGEDRIDKAGQCEKCGGH